jgi:hypothetical protein
MDAGQREYLQKRYRSNDWSGRVGRAHRVIKDFGFDGSEIKPWKMQRLRRDQQTKLSVVHSIWSHGESTNELIAIDVFECASVKSAHDRLIEALGNMESDAVVRRAEKSAPGEIAFGLGDTMMLYSRANVVVLIRNAGPSVVSVTAIARELDDVLVQRLENRPPRGRPHERSSRSRPAKRK